MWADIFGFNPKKPVRKQVRAAHIEWRVWRNGSVTVFQTEGVGSSPATRTKRKRKRVREVRKREKKSHFLTLSHLSHRRRIGRYWFAALHC